MAGGIHIVIDLKKKNVSNCNQPSMLGNIFLSLMVHILQLLKSLPSLVSNKC